MTCVALSASAVLDRFNALFGVKITLPIIQSSIHHIETDDFGNKLKAYYESMIACGEESVPEVSEKLQQ